MSKKTFKNKTEHLNRLFPEPEGEIKTREPQRTPKTPFKKRNAVFSTTPPEPKYYRLNLKLKSEYKKYLADASWAARKSITEYMNDLIEADRIIKDTEDT